MAYVPERGDAVCIDLNPRIGHEQAGVRPVIVLSPKRYNARSGLIVGCPVTTQAKGYVFEVAIPEGGDLSGVVLADQVKSVSWKSRQARYLGRVPDSVVESVVSKVIALIRPDEAAVTPVANTTE